MEKVLLMMACLCVGFAAGIPGGILGYALMDLTKLDIKKKKKKEG